MGFFACPKIDIIAQNIKTALYPVAGATHLAPQHFCTKSLNSLGLIWIDTHLINAKSNWSSITHSKRDPFHIFVSGKIVFNISAATLFISTSQLSTWGNKALIALKLRLILDPYSITEFTPLVFLKIFENKLYHLLIKSNHYFY